MSRGWLICLLLWSAPVTERANAAPNPQPPASPPVLPVPDPEISNDMSKVALPVVPRFTLPGLPDGLHSPREVLVAGTALRGTRIRVAGYITWIYDCAAALAAPKRTRAQIRRMIDDDPTLCERPKFYLGDARKAAATDALWVVDVPRPPFKLEKERLPAQELASWPAVPRLAVGAYAVVTGTLALESPHHERNSDGLLVYEAIEFPRGPARATPVAAPEATLPPVPPVLAPSKSVAPFNADASITHSNAGNRAYGRKQFDVAIQEFEAAIRAWDGNHSAWYGLIGARAQGRDFAGAAAAAEHCIALVPSNAMYWLFRGRMLYEAMIQDARKQEASRQNRPVDQVVLDASKLDFTPGLQALLVALQLDAGLWRAHYVIGRIHRDRGEAKAAAEHFTQSLALHASDHGPYVALVELYRRWQYRDEAVAVAELGTRVVPASADLWFELGMVHDASGNDARAIEAFTRALDLRPEYPAALFQRGQSHFRKHDTAHATADLEAFVALAKTSGGYGFELVQAASMLGNLAR